VTGLDVTPGGVTVHSSAGDIDAEVVVGADGVGSLVRRTMGVSQTPFVAQAVEVDTEPVSTDFRRDLLTFDLSRRDLRGYYWDFPTLVNGRPLVCRGVYGLKPAHGEQGPELDEVLSAALSARGLRLSDYKKKRYAERGFHRKGRVSAPRVLLVGEAAGIDPVTGEGIAQAIQYGARAGEYLSKKLREGDVRFDDWAKSVRGASIGRDLWVRSTLARAAYGKNRPVIERYLLDTPEFLRVGLQHFGGRKWSKRAVTNSAVGAVVAVVKGVMFRADNASTLGKVGLP
jgi:flavin-dependent dehydrogenase